MNLAQLGVILTAVAGIGFGYSLCRLLHPPQPTPAKRITDSFWHGYRVGHTDGVRTATAVERTPSPN